MEVVPLKNHEVLANIKDELSKLIVRDFLRNTLKNFSSKQTYIIYDNKRIEIFDESFFKLEDRFGKFKSYYISKPVKLPGLDNEF